MSLLLKAALAANLPPPKPEDFTGYQVFSLTPHSPSQVSWLLELRTSNSSLASEACSGTPALDWWSEPGQSNTSVLVSVPPHCHSEMERLVKREGIEYNVTIHDLEQLIREERKYRYYIHSFHWHSQEWSPEIYHNLEEIEDRLESLLSQHSNLLSRQHLGVTAQGRNIDAIIVKKDDRRTKPVIWLDCGIHAREWVSPPACLHAIHTLVQDSNSVQPRGDLLDAFDFYILPVANPDGYVYSWTHNRMWRKNRAGGKSFADDCTGVDPNRNFDADFASAPRHQCKESYRGTHAFSEAESRAIKRGVELIKSTYGQDRLAAFVSIHAYSQFWMSPMGYTWDRPKDYKDHMRVMKTATDALTSVYGTRFKYGPISEVIYIAAGSSVDWAYENAGIKYSFGLELRDSGRMGFMLPQSEIQPTVKETWAGLTAMAWAIAPEFGVQQGSVENGQSQAGGGLPGGLEITFG